MSHRVTEIRQGAKQGDLAITIAVFALAFGVLATRAVILPMDLTVVPLEPIAVGEAVATRHAFADPFGALATGPTAHVAPGFPFLYAAIRTIFTSGETVSLVLQLTASAAAALQLVLLARVTSELGSGPTIGITAAILGILLPMGISYWSDASYTGLLLIVMFIILAGISGGTITLSLPSCLTIGVLGGVVVLFNPVTAVIIVPWIVSAKLPRGKYWLKPKQIIVVVMGIVIAPWLFRNAVTLHVWSPVRDNFGLELDVGNNDCADYALSLNLQDGCTAEHHPNLNIAQAQLVRSWGEAEYNRVKFRTATRWILNHPIQFLNLARKRVVAFWFPPAYVAQSPWFTWMLNCLTVVSVPGFVILTRQSHTARWLFYPTFVCYPAIYYIVQYDERYRMPTMWATLIAAAFTLDALAGSIRRRIFTS